MSIFSSGASARKNTNRDFVILPKKTGLEIAYWGWKS